MVHRVNVFKGAREIWVESIGPVPLSNLLITRDYFRCAGDNLNWLTNAPAKWCATRLVVHLDSPMSQPFEPHYSLEQAVAHFFPHGPLTVCSLRTLIRQSKLQAFKVAGKLMVTESGIQEMLSQCRVIRNRPASTSREKIVAAKRSTLSATERNDRALASGAMSVSKLSKPSPTTSTRSTRHQQG